MEKSDEAFRTISEVAGELSVPKHVLRFWEAKFPQIKPMKLGGGRRYYRPDDLELLKGIHRLLQAEGYTIKGVQKILRQHGVEHVKGLPPPPGRKRAAKPEADAAPKRERRTERARAAPPLPEAARAAITAAIAELTDCRRILAGEDAAAGDSPHGS